MPAARSRSQFVDEIAREYVCDHTSPPDNIQQELQAVTREKTGRASGMQIGDDQAVFMEILARSMGARSGLEVGTFTGYSARACSGTGPQGHLLCCDVSEEWTAMSPRVLGEGRRLRQDRAEDRPGHRDSASATRDAAIRHRVPRCRQDDISRLLRGDHSEASRGGASSRRQHPPGRQSSGSRDERRLHARGEDVERAHCERRQGADSTSTDRRRDHAGREGQCPVTGVSALVT